MKMSLPSIRTALLAAITLSLLISAAPAKAGPGYALSFNGSNQYVTASIPALSNYTVSAWVNLGSGGNIDNPRVAVLCGPACDTSAELSIQSLTSSSTGPQYLMLGKCGVFNGATFTNIAVPIGVWTHVAVTVNANQVNYFVNGSNAGAWSYGGSLANLILGTNIVLAANITAMDRCYNGTLDEVQIWNVALSQTNIQAGMCQAPNVPNTNLVAYWPFNEGQGTNTTADASGNGHTGALVNSPAWLLSGVPFVPDATTSAATNIGPTSAAWAGAVNPCNLPAAAWFQWGTNTSYGNLTSITNLPATNASLPVSLAVSNLTPGWTYHFCLVATNSAGTSYGSDQSFATLAVPPTVSNAPATGIALTTATLNGMVDPNGQSTSAWFQWGTNTSYGNVTSVTNLPATNASLAVSMAVSNLTPGLTYHFQLLASNSAGVTLSSDQSFATLEELPIVNSSPANGITLTVATLNGTINPNGLPASAWFQWGANTNYGNTSVVTNLGSGASPIALSYGLTGLVRGVTYHFRLVASNSQGSAAGSDMAFTPPGSALSFNGSNQYVTANIPVLTNNYTVCAWVCLFSGGDLSSPLAVLSATNCGGSAEVLIHSKTSSETDPQYLMLGRCGFFNSPTSTNAVPFNLWAHVAVTVDSNNLVSYFVNGLADVSWSGTGYNLSIGPNITLADNNIRHFNGVLADVQIWRIALSQTEIQAGMSQPPTGPEPGLVAYWPLDEGAGSTVGDLSGNGLTGNLVNSPPWVPFTLYNLTATTEAATAVNAYGATLNGVVSPGAVATTGWFQWGTTTNYGNTTPPTNLGSGFAGAPMSAVLSGLTAGATYHYRVAATNSLGLTNGADLTFLTPLFLSINAGLPPEVYNGSAAWGDYDNDGRLDILLTGLSIVSNEAFFVSQVYHNNGDGTFTLNTNAILPGVFQGSVAWGDYDNDGRLDILLTGQTSSGSVISQVYHNNGDGTFTLNTNAILTGVDNGSVAWGDYDNDGRLDILLTGRTSSGSPISQVYHNSGDGAFTLNTNAVLPGVFNGSVAWGDYDNDGWLDILLTGRTISGSPISQVYHNNGDGTFTLNSNVILPGVYYGSVAWGDYDNDGRLDILLTGQSIVTNMVTPIFQVYRNLTLTTNTPPTAPTGLTATVSNSYVTLAWAAASDLQTPAPALTYNLRAGSTPGGWDILSPQSDPAGGWRRLPQMGNSQEGTNAILDISSLGCGQTCYWSVQAVDSSWAGSPFAVEGSFIKPLEPPIAITLPAISIMATQASLQGTVNPNGLPTIVWFEWGATTNYDCLTTGSMPGGGSQTLLVSDPLTNLTGCTSYHYRIDAFNDLGLVLGADQSFTTPDAPRTITGCCVTAGGRFQFQFTGAVGAAYTVLCSTDLSLPLGSWTPVGTVTNIAPGQYQFTDPTGKTNQPQRFYLLRWP